MKNQTYQDLENTKVDLKNAHLQDFVFHYNIFTSSWAAIPRELYQQYWSDYNTPGIIRSSSIETLIDILGKVSVDPKFLDKIQ